MNSTKDGKLVAWLKQENRKLIDYSLDRPKSILFGCAILVSIASIGVYFTGKQFLPKFDEGTITVFVSSPPGTSLRESNRIGEIAEGLILSVPEVAIASRRTGRAEEDEHAEGVFNSEIDVNLKKSARHSTEVIKDIRSKISAIPGVAVGIGSPMAHRIDHMQSGIQAEIALKVFGPNLSELRLLAEDLRFHIQDVPGLVDLRVERVTTVPQIQIIPETQALGRFGIQPGVLVKRLEHALAGKVVGQVIEGQ